MGLYSGTVSGLTTQGEYGFALKVISFRLERHDESGKPLPRLAVEMRGVSLRGPIANGDRVELVGKQDSSGVVHTQRVQNVSTNSEVTMVAAPFQALQSPTAVRFSMILIIIIFIIVLAGFVIFGYIFYQNVILQDL